MIHNLIEKLKIYCHTDPTDLTDFDGCRCNCCRSFVVLYAVLRLSKLSRSPRLHLNTKPFHAFVPSTAIPQNMNPWNIFMMFVIVGNPLKACFHKGLQAIINLYSSE